MNKFVTRSRFLLADAPVAHERDYCTRCQGMRRPCHCDVRFGAPRPVRVPATQADLSGTWESTRQQLAQVGFPFPTRSQIPVEDDFDCYDDFDLGRDPDYYYYVFAHIDSMKGANAVTAERFDQVNRAWEKAVPGGVDNGKTDRTEEEALQLAEAASEMYPDVLFGIWQHTGYLERDTNAWIADEGEGVALFRGGEKVQEGVPA